MSSPPQDAVMINAGAESFVVTDPDQFFAEMPKEVAEALLKTTKTALFVLNASRGGGILVVDDHAKAEQDVQAFTRGVAALEEVLERESD